jgi:hypothetical protein
MALMNRRRNAGPGSCPAFTLAKIMLPATVRITLPTTTDKISPIRCAPFSTTTIVPSSR